MIDRAGFLRRAGTGAGALTLAELLGPAAAFAGGGGDFPTHPRWRFVFVSHDTLNPLLVATQFGAQDAAALVQCTVRWTGSAKGDAKETARALRAAIVGKADGIAVSIVEAGGFAAEVDAARSARIPLVAFNVESGTGSRRLPYIGENPYVSGSRVGAEIARLAPAGRVLLFAPREGRSWTERRLDGVIAGLGRIAKAPAVTVVRIQGSSPRELEARVAAALDHTTGVRGLFGVDGSGTLAVGSTIKRLGPKAKGLHGGGYDLLPGDLSLVADGHLDFVVDQQPYVQGFTPVLQLFLARISEGTVVPWDTETSVLLRKADVKPFLDTKSRFEGSSSRHQYPLRRE
ncbi:MAG TPA: substrate-binding domain-containing protein [Gaiellaceae bacterium]|nr:substrate-binding domain-containing protein [Gaiellaceae bacterium]